MVFLVPYDGSPAAAAALDRAVEHGEALGRDVVAVSFVPTGTEFAQRRIWVDPDEDFALDSARQELERKIDETTDETELVYDDATAGSPDDGIATEVRQVALDVDATVLFVGASDTSSDEDEGLVTPFGPISADADYDVHVVRTA
ncbi:universal stress protein [Halobacteriales archaeon Cl-PHB]